MKKLSFTIPHGWALGVFMPVFAYIMFETTTGNLPFISFTRALINLAFYYLIYGLVFLLLNRFRIAMIGTTAVLYVIAAVNYYVLQFKGSPLLLPQDLFAWRTAASVVGNYKIVPSKSILLGGLLLVLAVFLLLHTRVEKLSLKMRGIFAGIYLLLSVGWLTAFYKYDVKYTLAGIDDDIFWWSLPGSYQDFGYATSTAILLKSTFFEKPEGYSPKAAAQAAENIAYERQSISAVTPENLIFIMNESLSELKMVGDFDTNEEYFPFLNSLKENTIRGELHVQVFGGGTSNTEYEALTGHSMAFLPYVISAYQAYSKENELGLASTMKAQGYTTVAMHPNSSSNWNRKAVYQYMGFDEFISSSGFRESERLRIYVSDRGDYERLIQRYEEKTPGEKFFCFNVTMQNHGGYQDRPEDFPEDVRVTGDLAGYGQTDFFLSLMKASDDAFAYLLDYFSNISEPTMIVLFGDHQPGIESAFYEGLYGKPLKDLSPQEADRQYVTPLIIWTNYDIEEKDLGAISANYLGSKVLELANLDLAPYNEYLLSVWKEIPVIGKNGYYLSDGSYFPWVSDTPEPQLIKDYRFFEYNYVADRKRRLDHIFQVSQ